MFNARELIPGSWTAAPMAGRGDLAYWGTKYRNVTSWPRPLTHTPKLWFHAISAQGSARLSDLDTACRTHHSLVLDSRLSSRRRRGTGAPPSSMFTLNYRTRQIVCVGWAACAAAGASKKHGGGEGNIRCLALPLSLLNTISRFLFLPRPLRGASSRLSFYPRLV